MWAVPRKGLTQVTTDEQFTWLPDGGLVAVGQVTRERPQDWLAWHFTHVANLESIVRTGALLSAASAPTRMNVGQISIKRARTAEEIRLPASQYPPSYVSDHVPLYFAGKSPMLFKVCRGHDDYRGGPAPLVFLGFRVGDIAASGCVWCATNANAATSWADYTTDLAGLGEFVDFDVLTTRIWKRTPDAPDRPSRRAAELLVHRRLPLNLLKLVVTQNVAIAQEVSERLASVGLNRAIRARPDMYY